MAVISLQTIRLDNTNVELFKDFIVSMKSYLHEYLVVKEYGSETGKPHLQGWIKHTATPSNFSKIKAKHYSDGKSHTKSFKKMRDYTNHVAYILNNEGKPDVKYSDCITNLSEQAFNNLQGNKRFVVHKTKDKDPYERTLQAIEDACVIDGKIQYDELLDEYLKYVPKKLSGRIVYDNLLGITIRLEYKYPENNRVHVSLARQVRNMDEYGIFSSNFCRSF